MYKRDTVQRRFTSGTVAVHIDETCCMFSWLAQWHISLSLCIRYSYSLHIHIICL